jgi:hypothetical protein
MVQLVYGKQRFTAGFSVASREGMTMLRRIEPATGFAHDPARRGFHAVYRAGEVNHCPACGRTHWYVGRLLAECGFCAAALPLIETGMTGVGLFRQHQRFDEAA